MRFITVPPTMVRENIVLKITSNTSNYNIFTSAGSPNRAVNVLVIVNPGVVVNSTVSSTPAMQTGSGWRAGSTLLIINKGTLLPAGGVGGAGAYTDDGRADAGIAGASGGNALSLTLNIRLDNTSGYIFGSGGGGGGGGATANITGISGGGGGGGAGSAGGAGGAGGASDHSNPYPGVAGTAGSTIGGVGGTENVGLTPTAGYYDGGDGGGYATAGETGESGYPSGIYSSGGAGGAAGKAIALNGKTVTWLGGNNPTQVKGAVS